MAPAPLTSDAVIRRLLLALLILGLTGTATELVLLEHYEDAWQWIPLGLIAVAFAAIGTHLVTGSRGTLRTLQVVMGLLVVAGAAGVVLHYRGNLEFQLEMDATLSSWQLFQKVIHAKAPPALAPGSMTQLGLLGLVYTYRHPLLRSGASSGPLEQT